MAANRLARDKGEGGVGDSYPRARVHHVGDRRSPGGPTRIPKAGVVRERVIQSAEEDGGRWGREGGREGGRGRPRVLE